MANSPKASIRAEVELFTEHMESLSDSTPLVITVLQGVGKEFKKAYDEFEAANCQVEKRDDRSKSITMKWEHHRQWRRLSNRVTRNSAARQLVPRSMLVALVSQYDAFLGRLLRAIFLLRPETLHASERQLSFSQLVGFSNIDAAREFVIDKEVESVLRSSHADQFKWMENRFGIPLRKDLEIWPQFIEVTERRNLFVHTDGIVSGQYLAVCKEHNYKFDKIVVDGQRLGVSNKYFQTSYECLYEMGVKLAHVLWRRLLPDDRKEADDAFITATYDLIENEQYRLAAGLLDFACQSLKKYSDESRQLVITINRAQAHKWLGNADAAKRIMAEVDWSAKGDEFKLADAVLAERWEDAYSAMRRIGRAGGVAPMNYRDWPLFKELRNQDGFSKAYREIFDAEFVAFTVAENVPADPSEKEDASKPKEDSEAKIIH